MNRELKPTPAAPSQEPAVQQGWKATPAMPDPDMVRAGWECLPSGTTLPWDYGARKCREVWAAMHAAARAAPAAPSQEPVTDYKARYEYLLHHMGLVEAHARTWNPARHKPLMAYLEDFIIAALRAKGGK